jgi:hypothetical protein
VEWLNGFAALYETLLTGSNDVGPAAILLAGCLKVKETYSAMELEKLLSGRPGFPTAERGWRERVYFRKWPKVKEGESQIQLFRVDAETLTAVRIVAAETMLRGVLDGR